MFPQHGAVWEFLKNLLSHGNIGQQHELLHHGVCLPIMHQNTGLFTQLREWHDRSERVLRVKRLPT